MVHNAVLYTRSATEGPQVDRKLKACQAWAQANGYVIVGEYSEVKSGLAKRLPGLQRAIRHAYESHATLVSFIATDLGRDAHLLAKRMNACKQMNVPLVFVSLAGGRS